MRHIVLFVFYMILFQINTFGQTPRISQEPQPAWVQASSKSSGQISERDVESGFLYEKIDYQVHIEQKTVFSRQVKEITSIDGIDQVGQIYIVFSPDYQKLVFHELKVLREGQALNRLDLSKFKVLANETDLNRSIYNGTYAAHLILDDLRVRDKLVLSYSIKGFNPVFGDKYADDYYFQNDVPIGLNHVVYIASKDRPLKNKLFNGLGEAKVKPLANNLVSYSWEEANLPVVHSDSYEPYWYFTHKYAQVSDYKSWQEVSDWVSTVNPIDVANLKPLLKNKIEEFWRKSGGEAYAYLQLVTRFVQDEIRYMGVEVGEYSHRPNNPNKVIEQRYGDCKDKSMLMATFLNAKDIPCKLVLVNSYNRYELKNYLPTPFVFNHMVVYVNIDGRAQYIDPTFSSQGGPVRDLYFPYYGNTLITEPKTDIAVSPMDKAGKTAILEQYHMRDDNKAELLVITTHSGYQADKNRSTLRSSSRSALQKDYLNFYTRLYPQIKTLDNVSISDDREENVIQIKERYMIDSFTSVEESSKRRYLEFSASSLVDNIPSINVDRSSPISLTFPYSAEHEIQLISKQNKGVPAMPFFVDRAGYAFGRSVLVHGDTLKMNF